MLVGSHRNPTGGQNTVIWEAAKSRQPRDTVIHKSINSRRPLNWDKVQCTREGYMAPKAMPGLQLR